MSSGVRVLMITQRVDASDPLLAFVVGWVRALAARVASLDVVCYGHDGGELLPNVRITTIGTRAQRSRLSRLAAFERAVWSGLHQADVVLAHMSPRLACWSGAAALARGTPMVLWYVHRHVSPELRLATTLCSAIGTATADSFPIRTGKVRVLGHGVDATYFAPDGSERIGTSASGSAARIVMVGRLSPVKRQDLLVEALPHLLAAGVDARVRFVGGPAGEIETLARLRAMAGTFGVADRVTFDGPLSPQGVRDALREADVAVNLSPTGLYDKAALESMLTGTPTIVVNRAFAPIVDEAPVPLCLDRADASVLADAIRGVLSLSPTQRRTLTMTVRERAIADHSLEPFIGRLVSLLESVA